MKKLTFLLALTIACTSYAQVNYSIADIQVNDDFFPSNGTVEMRMSSLSAFQLKIPLIEDMNLDSTAETRVTVSFPGWNNPWYLDKISTGEKSFKDLQIEKYYGPEYPIVATTFSNGNIVKEPSPKVFELDITPDQYGPIEIIVRITKTIEPDDSDHQIEHIDQKFKVIVLVTNPYFDDTTSSNDIIISDETISYSANDSIHASDSIIEEKDEIVDLQIPIDDGHPEFLDNVENEPQAEAVLSSDSLALVALYNSTNGPGWRNRTNWLTGPVDTWYGVYTSNDRVIQISLSSNYLSGTIPAEIGDLTSLEYLYLPYNSLTGTLPAEFYTLSSLYYLYLGYNQFSSLSFGDLGQMTSLEYLGLERSDLSGSIPLDLLNLTNLRSLNLNGNQFSTIPTEFFNFISLTYLNLGNNQFSGAIPPAIGNLVNLQNLYLNSNQFSGMIPIELFDLTSLRYLDLSNNQLSGQLSSSIGNLSNLNSLSLRSCQFSGEIPPELYNLTSLRTLEIQYNDFTGPISSGISNLINLNNLIINGNEFIGEIPSELQNLTSLRYVNIASNQFTGPFPQVGNSPNIYSLHLEYNQFSGEIPSELYNLTELNYLNLNYNDLTGPISASISNLNQLSSLYLQGNDLSGAIPSEFGSLISLRYLELGFNEFTGPFPQVGNMLNMYSLHLEGNQFSGAIPSELYNLTSLRYLYLNSNQFTGPISSSIGALLNLEYLYLNSNQLGGGIPEELYNLTSLRTIDLRYNQFSGGISPNIGNLTNLQNLYLYGNQFSGELPAQLYTLSLIRNLNLSYNNFTNINFTALGQMANLYDLRLQGLNISGTIPLGLENSTSLRYLYLSSNQITAIPEEFFNIPNLYYLSLAYNQISGSLSSNIGNLSTLNYLYLYNNQISGALPSEITQLTSLRSFNIQNNSLEDLPSLAGMSSSLNFNVSYNNLTFEDIEINIGIPQYFYYAPQAPLGEEQYVTVPEGGEYNLSADCGGANNLYQWFRDDIPISGAQSSTYNLTNFSETDAGAYNCQITNTVATALALYTLPIHISSLEAAIEQDSLALVALYNALNGPGWANKSNWLTGPVETWYGVSMTNSRVTTLSLTYNGLSGQLPAEIGDLTALTSLYLGGNQINGSIPSEISHLRNLEYLNFYYNRLSGGIPVEIYELTSLKSMSLARNSLSGNISANIGNLSSLEYLYLYNNQLSGQLPEELFNAISLRYISLYSNGFYGNIPAGIGNLTDLSYLNLRYNNLSGDLPLDFYDLNNLTNAYLGDNYFTNINYSELGQMINLRELDLSESNLSGPFSVELTNLTNLRYLDLTQTQLTGLPDEIGNMSLLQYLYLGNNQISAIPSSISSLVNLETLYLYSNLISTIPDELYSLTSLVYLDLNNNQISGPISPLIGNLSNIEGLYLYRNQLSGLLPAEIGGLTQLRSLYLYENLLSGALPAEIGMLLNLTGFHISDNQFSAFPSEISALSNLRYFQASNNLFTGALPAEIGLLSSIYDLDISENQFSGMTDLSGLTGLSYLRVHDNNLDFGDLEIANVDWASMYNAEYNPQADILASRVEDSGEITLSLTIDGSSNLYQWYNMDTVLAGENTPELIINDTDIGAYLCMISDPNFPELILYSSVEEVGDPAITNGILETEYNALVALYNATDGDNWDDNSNWLTEPDPDNWYGVEREGIHIKRISLGYNNLNGDIPQEIGDLQDMNYLNFSNNQLSGTIPVEMGNLTNLKNLYLYQNQLTGAVPTELNNMDSLEYLYLDNNELTELPGLSGLGSLRNLIISYNRLTFGDIEANLGVASSYFNYAPQKSFGTTDSIFVAVGEDQLISINCSGSANIYQWRKNYSNISGATSPDYLITGAGPDDAGHYTCRVTSSIVTGLVLYSNPIYILVAGCSLPAGWNVDPASYTQSASVTAKVFIDDVPAESGYLGAFVGNECRGLANASISAPSGHHIFNLICYSNVESGEMLSFKYYDVETCEVFEPFVETLEFIADTTIGEESAPFELHYPAIIFNRSLLAGWNMFSLPVHPYPIQMMDIVQALRDEGSLGKIQDEAGWAIEPIPGTDDWIDNIGEWSRTEGYKIRVTQNTTLSVSGAIFYDSVDIDLLAGWNIMGYPSLNPQGAMDALVDLVASENLLKVQNEAGWAIEPIPGTEQWIDDIGDFNPGEGYKVLVGTDNTLTINQMEAGSSKSAHSKSALQPQYFKPVWEGNGLDHMNIYLFNISIDNAPMEPGDEIAVFDGPLCVGAVVIQDIPTDYVSLTASLDDPSTKNNDGFADGNSLRFKIWKASTASEAEINSIEYFEGSEKVFQRLGTTMLNLSATNKNTNSKERLDIQYAKVYPNPFTHDIALEYTLDRETDIIIKITNVLGAVIVDGKAELNRAGANQWIWDGKKEGGEEIPPGIYYMQMYSGEHRNIKTFKIVKQ